MPASTKGLSVEIIGRKNVGCADGAVECASFGSESAVTVKDRDSGEIRYVSSQCVARNCGLNQSIDRVERLFPGRSDPNNGCAHPGRCTFQRMIVEGQL
jgi:hypothetical protein